MAFLLRPCFKYKVTAHANSQASPLSQAGETQTDTVSVCHLCVNGPDGGQRVEGMPADQADCTLNEGTQQGIIGLQFLSELSHSHTF